MKRLVALLLVVLSLSLVALPAMADQVSIQGDGPIDSRGEW